MLKPLFWIGLILLCALFTKDASKRKRRLIAVVVLLFLCGNNFLVNILASWYEPTFKGIETKTYNTGIVLGGFAGVSGHTNETEFYESGDRFLQAVKLLKQGTIKHLIISSGARNRAISNLSEAEAVATYLKQIGIPDSLYTIESNSRNTIENALYCKNILKIPFDSSTLVITSAWHIPRASLCFSNCSFYPTNYMSDAKWDFSLENILLPQSKAFNHLEYLLKEWVGYVVYYFKK